MITGMHIENFKSLANFDLNGLGKFVCLIGINGAGKTTLLQALDFMSHLAVGYSGFRNWSKTDIATNGSASRVCVFKVDFETDGVCSQWECRFNANRQKVIEEHFRIIDGESSYTVLSIKDGRMTWGHSFTEEQAKYPKDVSTMTYEGSVMAAFSFDNQVVAGIKKTLQSLESLEQLSPEKLRKAGQGVEPIGIGGDGLPGFLNKLSADDEADLNRRMREIYPDVCRYEIKRKRFGWKKLVVNESVLKYPVTAEHVNDGYLRMLAIISQRYSDRDFILFDEIENGINQEVVAKLLTNLTDYNGKQVMVTTHSPLILNYLPDEVATRSVYLLSKDENGHTHARRFFEIPSIAEKLNIMGPGEVMNDTDLMSIGR